MKRFFSFLMVILLTLSTSPAASSELKTDYFVFGGAQMPPRENLVVHWVDATLFGINFSLDPFDPTTSEQNRRQVENSFTTVLGMCDDSTTVGCISAVEYKTSESWEKAIELPSPGQRRDAFGSIAANNTWDIAKTATYPADASKGLFRASEPNLFELKDAEHRLGNQYFINAVLTSRMVNGVAKIQGVDLSAWAVKIISGSSCPGGTDVVTIRGSYCQILVNMPTDVSLRVSVNLGDRLSELSGWFDGRIMNPEVDLGISRPGVLTVEGSPIEVSTAKTSLIPKGDPFYTVGPELEAIQQFSGFNSTNEGRNDGIQSWRRYEPKIEEIASSTNTYWRLSSWVNDLQGRYGCQDSKGVLGIVLTNASAYSPGAPVLDTSAGSLNFEVAAPHFAANGEKFLGFYDLLVKESVAKCIWGNNLSSSQAQISVLDIDGVPQVATTTFSLSKGWAKFKASGFTFSEKEIKVKITQPQTRTLTNYLGRATALTSKQKAEIKATVTKGAGNTKFICTGIRLVGQPAAQNALVRQRAKLACDYAKTLNPKLSTFFQTKTTQARSFNGRVLVVSK